MRTGWGGGGGDVPGEGIVGGRVSECLKFCSCTELGVNSPEIQTKPFLAGFNPSRNA